MAPRVHREAGRGDGQVGEVPTAWVVGRAQMAEVFEMECC